MTIRPVDLQTMIPKLPEVQKARNAENELEKNNLNINIHKEQQQHEKNTKQVVEKDKVHGVKVDREGHQQGQQSGQEKEHKDGQAEDKEEQAKETTVKHMTTIDIRI